MNTQTAKIGFDSQTGIYALDPSTITHSPATIEVNGLSIQDPLRKRVIGGLVTFKQKPETITYLTTNRVLTHFITTGGKIYTPTELQDIKDELLANAKYDDEDDEYVFNSVEEEVAYQVFTRTVKPVYDNQETLHNVNFEIIEYPVSEYPEIVPIYSIDAKNIFDTKCKITINESKVFFDICNKLGVDPSTISQPKHSGIRFIKINDKYVSGTEQWQKTFSRDRILTYTECVDLLQEAYESLQDLIQTSVNKESMINMKKLVGGEFLSSLINLENRFSAFDPRSKDANGYRSTLSSLADLRKTLSNVITEKS